MIENLPIWLSSGMIILLAATLQGITGFGFALISVPLLLLIYDPHTAVTLNIIISIASLSFLTFKVRQVVVVPLVKNLSMGSLLGIPFGVYIFLNFDVNLLKLTISVITLIFCLILMSGLSFKNITGYLWERIVGSISGIMTSSMGMPGPPIILFFSNQRLSKERFRATSAAYFILAYVVSLFLLISFGATDRNVILTAISLIPFAILGGHLGYIIFPRVSQSKFRHIVISVVLCSSLYSLVTVIR